MENELSTERGFIESYDRMILAADMRAMYGHSGFYNVGKWSEDTADLNTACTALVNAHLDIVEAPEKILHILDAGCGLGSGSGIMAKRFSQANISAINISAAQIDFAREKFPGIQFSVMDAAELFFPDSTFDLIVSVEAAFHFNTRTAFLKNAFRTLRPGGQLILTDILFKTTEWVGAWSVPAENLLPDSETYRQECLNAGFSIQQIEDITAISWNGFCRHIETTMGMQTLAAGLRDSVNGYLLVHLKKPG